VTAQRIDRLIAAGIFSCVLVVTAAASKTQGIHRDEAVYMTAGEKYISYWGGMITRSIPHPFSSKTIDQYWNNDATKENNSEHPPLMKTLYGLSWRLFHACHCSVDAAYHPGVSRLAEGERHVTLPLFTEATAFRFPTMILFALLAAFVYLFYVAWAPIGRDDPLVLRAGALAASLLTVAQPRAFFHAETAAFDLPASMFWFVTTYAYWRALASPRPIRAAIVVGVLYGLFLATKLQSFFLPLALGAHWIYLAARKWRAKDRPWLPRPWPLIAMATISPLLFYLQWPYLWHHTWAHLKTYMGFHIHHDNYNFEYLGHNYNNPPFPWHEPLGMLVTTAPVILLVLAIAGIVVLVRRGSADSRRTRALILVAAFVPVAPFFRGTTPIFGETKHWLATMPYLAMCAGVAVQMLAARLVAEWKLSDRARLKQAVVAAIVAVVFAPACVETVRSHPYGLSHYNALAGGAPGGADLGMNRQFWGYSVRGLLPWFNKTLAQGTKIYPHDWNQQAYLMYLRDRVLRRDLTITGDARDRGIENSQVALVIHELHFNKYEYMIWNAYKTVRPVKVLSLDGVPLVTVYSRDQQ
jgi:hypothetical protein